MPLVLQTSLGLHPCVRNCPKLWALLEDKNLGVKALLVIRLVPALPPEIAQGFEFNSVFPNTRSINRFEDRFRYQGFRSATLPEPAAIGIAAIFAAKAHYRFIAHISGLCVGTTDPNSTNASQIPFLTNSAPAQTYQTKFIKPNPPIQTYQTKSIKPNLPNETSKIKPTKPNLSNQTYQTKPSKIKNKRQIKQVSIQVSKALRSKTLKF